MRRPAFYVLILFTLGIILGSISDLPLPLLFTLLSLAIVFGLITLVRKDNSGANFFLTLSIILAGVFRYELSTRDFPSNHISKYLNLDSKVTIEGKVADDPDVRADKTFLIIETEKILVKDRSNTTTGRIILKVKEPTFRFDYGDEIKVIGYLNEPSSRRNPGAFDYKRYLNRRNIYGMVTLSQAEGVKILGKSEGGIFQSKLIIPLRRWIQGVFDENLSGDHKALLSGFLLGETKGISPQVYSMFRDTGTVHLLAVSGSNVWLVVGVILGALTLLRVPKLVKVLLSIICIIIFANLTHNQPPVVRASIMAGLILIGTLLYKDVDLVNMVSFAGLVILSVSPLFLFDVGFQLSFASVFAILLLYPRFKSLIPVKTKGFNRKLWKWVITPALISLSVEIVLFPILGYYFNMVPLVCMVANVIVVPLAGISVVLACFTLFSAIFSSGLATIFSASNWFCLDLTLKLNQFFANLPVAKITIAAPSAFGFISYYAFIGSVVWGMAVRKRKIIFPVLLILNLLVWKVVLSQNDGRMKVTFLDVNQGSSAVVELPNRDVFLINSGERVKNFDGGEQIVVPFLFYEGYTRIDKLILTETDSSNLYSARSIMENIGIGQVVSPRPITLNLDKSGEGQEVNPCDFVDIDSIKAIKDNRGDMAIVFYDYSKTGQGGAASSGKVIKIIYRNTSLCLFDGQQSVGFDSLFDWQNVQNCSILVLSELGKEEEIVKLISAINPQHIIFTKHYMKYRIDRIPIMMALNFPKTGYHRTAERGAIICETDGKKLSFDYTLK
jgi:competence protein ComEC